MTTGACSMIWTVYSAPLKCLLLSGSMALPDFSLWMPARNALNISSFACPWMTINFHGCLFLDEGAFIPLSIILQIISCGISLSENLRILLRLLIASIFCLLLVDRAGQTPMAVILPSRLFSHSHPVNFHHFFLAQFPDARQGALAHVGALLGHLFQAFFLHTKFF